MVADDVETYTKLTKLEAPEPYEGKVSWFGIADHYFAVFLLPDESSAGKLVFSPRQLLSGATAYGEHYVIPVALEAGEALTERFRMFIGPKKLDLLGSVHPDLPEAVQLGWFGFFARILLYLLQKFHGWVGNWGLAIVCLTLLVKGVFFPLTQMSFRSSQAMQALQPKLQEIREQFKDNQEELNKRTIAMFRENGVNPVGGCLPMLVQMPVWIALYSMLQSSVDLYQTKFLYLKDLSSADPYGVLPLVVVVLMMVQQQFMPMGNMDPSQQRIMKIMPLFFGLLFFTFPSGLVVYIFVNMVLTILQQWFIKRTFKAPVTAATS
jgi:YidC/Oxa1 family membrane protein insertase